MSDMPMFERYPFNVDPLPEEGPYGGEGQKCHIGGFANLLGFAKPN